MLGRAVPRRVPAACGKSTCSCGGGAGHWHLGFNQAGSSGEQWQGAHLAQRQPPSLEVPACRGQGMYQLVAVPASPLHAWDGAQAPQG